MAEPVLLKSVKMMVVDDNPVNLKVVKDILLSFGGRTYLVTSGADCLALAEKHEFDIIFLDQMMPGMDGVKTLHELKKSEKNVNTKIIALTANSEKGVKEFLLTEGFDDFIAKPVDCEVFHEVLLKYVDPEKLVKR